MTDCVILDFDPKVARALSQRLSRHLKPHIAPTTMWASPLPVFARWKWCCFVSSAHAGFGANPSLAYADWKSRNGG